MRNYTSPVDLAKDDPWLAEQLAREKVPVHHVVVPTKLTSPSPVLSPTISAINAERRKAIARETAHCASGKPLDYSMAFDGLLFKRLPTGLRVSISSADRAILILDTLIKACQARGLRTFVEKKNIRIGCGEHSARIRISERVEQRHGSTKGLSNFDLLSKRNVAHTPTAQLTMFIERLSLERKLCDKQALPLELQMNAAIVLVCRSIAETRRWHECSAAQMQAFAEAGARVEALRRAQLADLAEVKRLESERKQRIADLVSEAASWHDATTTRAYIAHLRAAAVVAGGQVSPSLHSWLDWATETASSSDPTNVRVYECPVSTSTPAAQKEQANDE